MRYGPDHKAHSKDRIVRAAAARLREQGGDRVSVAQVMADAGLTHGAFYAHFASKQALLAEAVNTMFAAPHPINSGLADALANPPAEVRAGLRAFLAGYLSNAHRDNPGDGCPLPALAADVARAEPELRTAFVHGLAAMQARLEQVLARIGIADAGAEASSLVAQLAGALALARAVGPGPQSDRILQSNLRALFARFGL